MKRAISHSTLPFLVVTVVALMGDLAVASAQVNREAAARAAIRWSERRNSLLDKTQAGISPFVTSNATAIIGRPSFDNLLDSALDFNNREGTASLTLAPAFLWTSYPNWYAAGLKVTGSANTEKGSFTIGGKYDVDFRDPRVYYGLYQADLQDRVTKELARCNEICEPKIRKLVDELDRLAERLQAPDLSAVERDWLQARLKEVEAKHERLSDEAWRCDGAQLGKVSAAFLEAAKSSALPGFSIGGNANYDNETKEFAGGTAAIAANLTWRKVVGEEPPPPQLAPACQDDDETRATTANAGARGDEEDGEEEHVPNRIEVPVTINASFEDALPKNETEDDADAEREKRAGGGVEVALRYNWDDAKRSVEVGGAFAALACVDTPCQSAKTTLRLNPFVALSITKSLGGRVDLLWEGEGDDFGSAIAGVSFKYSFSGLDEEE